MLLSETLIGDSTDPLDNIIGQDHVINVIKSSLETNIQNMIFTGPHGCGKSITANLIVDKYLGECRNFALLKIQGSINRGKNTITEIHSKKNEVTSENPNIINFIKKTMTLPEGKVRIIIIYDFDLMTDEAQMSLRRIIEKYNTKVRFILICNNLHYVIDAMQSRTTILTFLPISTKDIFDFLVKTNLKYKFNISEKILNIISIISNGDLRHALNIIDTFKASDNLSLTTFYNIFNIPSIETLTKIIKYSKAKKYNSAVKELLSMIDRGFNIIDISVLLLKIVTLPEMFTSKTESIRDYYINTIIKFIVILQNSKDVIHIYSLIGKLCNY